VHADAHSFLIACCFMRCFPRLSASSTCTLTLCTSHQGRVDRCGIFRHGIGHDNSPPAHVSRRGQTGWFFCHRLSHYMILYVPGLMPFCPCLSMLVPVPVPAYVSVTAISVLELTLSRAVSQACQHSPLSVTTNVAAYFA